MYLMYGCANQRRKNSPGSVVTSKADFACTGTIIDHQGNNFLIPHDSKGEMEVSE